MDGRFLPRLGFLSGTMIASGLICQNNIVYEEPISRDLYSFVLVASAFPDDSHRNYQRLNTIEIDPDDFK